MRMNVAKIVGIMSFGMLLCSAAVVDRAAADQWELEARVIEVQMTKSGQIFTVRYEGLEEFVPVEQGVSTEVVDGLSFYARDLDLQLYYGEEDGNIIVGYRNSQWCRTVFEDISKIVGLVRIDLDLSDGNMEVEFPHGQVVTVYESEVDFGDGPELRIVDFRKEAVSGIPLRGFRSFTLFEFFDPETKEVISRNVVATEVPLTGG
jgi:hypothetical protein